ncbi:MAG TPA: hypothetical protein VFA04_13630 [Bryobacteraceae bacterium]|nr:hypothetical protein [Bryobacteraceae bacterium]
MPRAIVVLCLAILLTACSASRAIDAEAAANALVQRMSRDGYSYTEVTDDPVFKAGGGQVEMRCAVRYVNSRSIPGSAGVLATFRAADGVLQLESYTLDPEATFRAQVATPER